MPSVRRQRVKAVLTDNELGGDRSTQNNCLAPGYKCANPRFAFRQTYQDEAQVLPFCALSMTHLELCLLSSIVGMTVVSTPVAVQEVVVVNARQGSPCNLACLFGWTHAFSLP